MSKKQTITLDQTKHVAKLANLQISDAEVKRLSEQLSQTIEVISELDELDTTKVKPTSQVTGLTNVFREDQVDDFQRLTQKQALSNAKQTHQGYFVVPQVIES